MRRSIPNWKHSPNNASTGFSQIASPTTVLATDDSTDFVQKERLDLPYGTMIQAICVVVNGSKCLDIPILEFSIILEHLPFLPSSKNEQSGNLDVVSMSFAAVICVDDVCSVNFA